MTTSPFLHPGGRISGSMICGNEFPRACWGGRATCGKASPIWIAAMEKHLKYGGRQWHRHPHRHAHRDQHRHILDIVSIRHWTTGYEPLRLQGKRRSTLLIHLWSGSQHHHWEESPISIRTQTHLRVHTYPPPYNCAWALVLKRNTTIFHFVVERMSTSTRGRISNSDSNSTARTVRLHTGINNAPARLCVI